MTLLLAVPVLVLPVVLLFAFAGCTGDDPAITAAEEKGRADQKAADDAKKAAELYPAVIKAQGATLDLRGYWRLDDPGTDAIDSHTTVDAEKRNGQYKNPSGRQLVNGAFDLGQLPGDRASAFDGVSSHVEVPHHLKLNPASDFTIEAWVRPEPGNVNRQVVISSWELAADGAQRGYALEVVANPTPKVFVKVGAATTSVEAEADLGDGSENNGWRHVVATYTYTERCLRLFVDARNAQPDKTIGSTSAPVNYLPNEKEHLRIGAGVVAGSGGSVPGQFFHGAVDEVAVYGLPMKGEIVADHLVRGKSKAPVP